MPKEEQPATELSEVSALAEKLMKELHKWKFNDGTRGDEVLGGLVELCEKLSNNAEEFKQCLREGAELVKVALKIIK